MEDNEKRNSKATTGRNSNFVSRLFFFWTLSVFKHGYDNGIQLRDVPKCSEADTSNCLGDALQRNWQKEILRNRNHNLRPNLLRAISETFIGSFSLFGILLFIQAIPLKLFQPFVLQEYIKFFETDAKERSFNKGCILGSTLIITTFLDILLSHHGSVGCQRVGMRCRVACSSLIFRKLLTLNQTSLGQSTVGHVINLMSNDVQRFDTVALFLHYIWIMPIQTVLAFFVMYRSVGLAALAGIGAVALQALPLQGLLSRLQGNYRLKIAERTDQRLRIINEIISGIKIIKMYTWEKPFERTVELRRKLEIDMVTKTSYIKGFSIALMILTGRVTLCLILFTYISMGNRLTSETVFSMAQLLATIEMYMAVLYSAGIAYYAEAKTSVKRIEDFLLLEENSEIISATTEMASNVSIKLSNGVASWLPHPMTDTESIPQQICVANVNLEVAPGTFCCVIGPIGAGKTSLLQVIIQELQLQTGRLEVYGRISYASQEPWTFVSSIRKNILFGEPYSEEKYTKVIQTCGLEYDFSQFPHGDKTLIGEKGVSLSGGQRARVNLARCIYRDADIYLFDDPLSAVDLTVGRQIVEECFMEYLRGKTIILVTHHVRFLKHCDFIVSLNHGQVEKMGSFNDFTEEELNIVSQQAQSGAIKNRNPEEEHPEIFPPSKTIDLGKNDEKDPEETEELLNKGAIPPSTYMEYCKASGSLVRLFILVILIIMAQVAFSGTDLWLTKWVNTEELQHQSGIQNPTTSSDNSTVFHEIVYSERQTSLHLGAYSVLLVLTILLTIARAQMFYKLCMNSSKALHGRMFSKLLRTTMSFFETNPSGRIMNRFSKDMGIIDEVLPIVTLLAVQMLAVAAGTIFITSVLITPYIIICVATFLGIIFYWLRKLYMASAQDIRRLEAMRNFKPGDIGVVISQTLVLVGMLQFGIRQTAEVANTMVSVERILQYCNLEEEDYYKTIVSKKSDHSWPEHGKIVFQSVYLRYKPEEPPVLKNVTFEIKPCEKIGIVGRTGAGKSSLLSALFRLAQTEGVVEIDDIDIKDIGLTDLRSRISVIPQEPVLFANTARYNLDPFQKYDDDTLWDVLEKVQLKKVIQSLNQQISEGGLNLSFGQRQLFCLARAILHNNKILIMDEATANIDSRTNGVIQTTIRENFTNCTILTIAHRLDSIMDSDRILVMDAGEVVEFDHPHELLKNQKGYFRKLLRETESISELGTTAEHMRKS